MGFDGIEYPLRPGYPVEPQDAEKGLPRLAGVLADHGLVLESVAASLDERIFAGCAAAGVKLIRWGVEIADDGYRASEARAVAELDAAALLCERYGLRVGIQNHYGRYVCNSMGRVHLLERCPSPRIGAVWDAMHNALCGEEPEIGLELVWDRLFMVNLKNGYWRRTDGPEALEAGWDVQCTMGPDGLASWPRVARYCASQGWSGPVCLTAEYTAAGHVDRLVAEDLRYARGLFTAGT